ncbi:unnamed protein product [Protopolystoma xenopodis]|uniref:Myosin motor domain-containing protein n=1 Tax=Protopolystoma xenopodis TaxID=117903 RepID=A0A3S5AS87_9PLAT|nr:unnamed protein product [Protopolystoma xenopodis]
MQGGCQITQQSRRALSDAASLFGIEPEVLANAMLFRETRTRGTGAGADGKLQIALRREEASAARDALAKAIYSRLFDFIVSCVNQAIPMSKNERYIGVLDIAGFGESVNIKKRTAKPHSLH